MGLIAFTNDGRAVKSPDGQDWSVQDVVPGEEFRGAHWAPGVGLVAVTFEGTAAFSPDGEDWTLASFPGVLRDVTYGDGLWVAVGGEPDEWGDGAIYTSTDGKTWSTACSGGSCPDAGYNYHSCAYGDGIYIAGTEFTQYPVSYSTDGQSWADGITDENINPHSAQIYGLGLYFTAGGDDGEQAYTSDPVNGDWTYPSHPTRIHGFATDDVMVVSVGADGFDTSGPAYTTDGLNWTQTATFDAVGVAYDPATGLWCAAADGGTAYVSEDGQGWTSTATGVTANLKAATAYPSGPQLFWMAKHGVREVT